MLSSINPRIRIGIVLILSFLISGFLMNYILGSSESIAPHINADTILSDFSRSISDSQSHLMSALQTIHIPDVKPATPDSIQPTNGPVPTIGFEQSPTQIPTLPTTIPILPTTSNIQPTSRIYPTTQMPTSNPPTSIPKPTKVPKPTATPAPPPITSDVRPGTSIEEIVHEVSKRACIPYALLMATRTMESGAWMKNMSASTTKLYNTYGWWKNATKTDVCAALAYYTQSGLIPSDSGGGSCTNGVQPGAYDQKIMGLMQVSEQEEQVTRKNTTATLPNNIDRRVLFDNAYIYAQATKGRAGKSPQPSCDDWPEETIRLVAEKHFGACAYGNGKNYCTEVWNLYKSFR